MPRSRSKLPARQRPSRRRPGRSGSALDHAAARVRITRPDPLALTGAAYVLTASAYVLIEGPKASPTVRLRPKTGSPDLKKSFLLEYENQRHRWALAKHSRQARRRTVARMLGLAERLSGTERIVASELAEDQKAEIASLLDEVKSETWDPLKIALPWEELKRKKGP